MAIGFLAINAYKKSNRIVVQYYDSGSQHKCLCPECAWNGDLPQTNLNQFTCVEFCCPQCATALAMISSKLPKNVGELRCL